jgi:uncharacterized membrane protein YphA (DoxX/SURF4 family)
MEQWTRLRQWIDANRDLAFDLVRIYLGIGLFVKGIEFARDEEFLSTALRQADSEFIFKPIEVFLAHYVVMAHIGGGLLLAAGLMTRTSAIFQLPILCGAVFLIYGGDGIFTHNQEFQFTALVLYLLVLILLHGAGRLSVDHYLRSR